MTIRSQYSHFSLVRTTSGKEKFFTSENHLLVRIFLKRWIPLVLPSPVILGKIHFFAIENYLSVTIFFIMQGFPCVFTFSVNPPILGENV